MTTYGIVQPDLMMAPFWRAQKEFSTLQQAWENRSSPTDIIVAIEGDSYRELNEAEEDKLKRLA